MSANDPDPETFELEPAPAVAPEMKADARPLIPQPLPVRIVAVADVTLLARAGCEVELDAFYEGLLGFLRIREPADPIVYRSDNFDVIVRIDEPPIQRSDVRPLGVEVESLGTIEQKLIEDEIEYLRQKSVQPGNDSLLILDPGGNWVELRQVTPFR